MMVGSLIFVLVVAVMVSAARVMTPVSLFSVVTV